MKATYLIATTVIGLALAAPIAAHHNSPFGTDLLIGDMMDRHEEAIDNLDINGAMDPSNSSDGSMIGDPDPQATEPGIADDPAGTDNGGNRGGEPWTPPL